MGRGFRARKVDGRRRYVVDLEADERRFLASLLRDVVELLDPPEAPADAFDALVADLDGIAQWPDDASERARSDPGHDDPAVARLLPAGSRHDGEAAKEYRRLTESGLRRRKADHLERSIAALSGADRVVLDDEGAAAFAASLTDLRLVLGERLGIRTEDDIDRLEALAAEDPESDLAPLVGLYDTLAWLQETLTLALLGDLPR